MPENNILVDARKPHAVITLGIDAPPPPGHPPTRRNFSGGVDRLEEELCRPGFSGDMVCWTTTYPKGCPPHETSPFAFKPSCFIAAYEMGYDVILWVDASIQLRAPLDEAFILLMRRGYLFFRENHSLGEYCKDEALAPLGIDREASFSLPSCRGSVLGLDLSRPAPKSFLQRWHTLSLDGVTFPGPKWSGVDGWPRIASPDPRVKGHRHDQTAASAVALQLGLVEWESKESFRYHFKNDRAAIRRVRSNGLGVLRLFLKRLSGLNRRGIIANNLRIRRHNNLKARQWNGR